MSDESSEKKGGQQGEQRGEANREEITVREWKIDMSYNLMNSLALKLFQSIIYGQKISTSNVFSFQECFS